MFKHILLATDGSAIAQKAGKTAISIAKTYGAEITAAFVIDPYPYMTLGSGSAAAFESYRCAARAEAAKVDARLGELAGDAQVILQTRVLEDHDVAAAIVRLAQEQGADLLVLGSHGRSGMERLILGNVAQKVLSLARLPVLVVR